MQTTSGFITNEQIIFTKEESKVPIGVEVFGLTAERAHEIGELVHRATSGDIQELNGRDEEEGSVHKVINYMGAQANNANELAYFMYALGFAVSRAVNAEMPSDPVSELMAMLSGMRREPGPGDILN